MDRPSQALRSCLGRKGSGGQEWEGSGVSEQAGREVSLSREQCEREGVCSCLWHLSPQRHCLCASNLTRPHLC